jgi:hypothetical protein
MAQLRERVYEGAADLRVVLHQQELCHGATVPRGGPA